MQINKFNLEKLRTPFSIIIFGKDINLARKILLKFKKADRFYVNCPCCSEVDYSDIIEMYYSDPHNPNQPDNSLSCIPIEFFGDKSVHYMDLTKKKCVIIPNYNSNEAITRELFYKKEEWNVSSILTLSYFQYYTDEFENYIKFYVEPENVDYIFIPQNKHKFIRKMFSKYFSDDEFPKITCEKTITNKFLVLERSAKSFNFYYYEMKNKK